MLNLIKTSILCTMCGQLKIRKYSTSARFSPGSPTVKKTFKRFKNGLIARILHYYRQYHIGAIF
jgi:hypothetical protein